MKRKHKQYVPAVEYSRAELERLRLLDLLCDARTCLRYARELANGANPEHYGCTREEYLQQAEQQRNEVRAARGKV